ncbi:site-2 protease family protein [bacterium]|nr:site-2 protease family protein [Mariniblastus sp.]MDB4623540.1 site-2 protease family protein [bacterium]|eukprot:COSAG01_NODE_73_length_28450_cov_1676.153645_9_plen_355_part_00
MSNLHTWSMGAGRWLGVPVRIHLLLILFVVALFGTEWNYSTGSTSSFAGTAIVTTLILLLSLLLHETAHIFASTNLGGRIDSITLFPWGGIDESSAPSQPHAKAVVSLAGPFANFVIFLFGTTLLIQSDHSDIWSLINPLAPHRFTAAEWQISLTEIVIWVNFQLAFFNSLPCHPFDGVEIVRAWISSLNPDASKFRMESAIRLIGNAVAFAFIGFAWFFRDIQTGPIQPTWILFLLTGITLLFSSNTAMQFALRKNAESALAPQVKKQDDQNPIESFFAFPAYEDDSAYSQWLSEKQDARREDESKREQEEDERADKILEKLHNGGIASLHDEEKLILDRVSERIRRRRQQGV